MFRRYGKNVQVDAVRNDFRHGRGVLLESGEGERDRISGAVTTIKTVLETLAPEDTFPGVDGLNADRQSFWVASRGFARGFSTEPSFIDVFDGDSAGGRRGLDILASDTAAAEAMLMLKEPLDRALHIATQAISLPPAAAPGVTIRYRAIRYAPLGRPTAGIGLHPDGNVLSALITDGPGLELISESGRSVHPPYDGILVLPGSILYRWSNGYFKPTFHRVEISRAQPVKMSIVAFLNFADQSLVPSFSSAGADYYNDVTASKLADLDTNGDLAELWSEINH